MIRDVPSVHREQELLSELDDRIEACQAKIHFTEQQIIALAPESASSEAVEAPKAPIRESTMLSALSALSDPDDTSECMLSLALFDVFWYSLSVLCRVLLRHSGRC